jgi:hypothetical protein
MCSELIRNNTLFEVISKFVFCKSIHIPIISSLHNILNATVKESTVGLLPNTNTTKKEKKIVSLHIQIESSPLQARHYLCLTMIQKMY